MREKLKVGAPLLICVAALLLPYIALCFFAHPVADDFDPVNQRMGLVNWVTFNYYGVTGRYTSMALLYLLATRSLVLYRFIAFGIIVLIPVSFYFLFTSLSGKAFSFLEKALHSFLFAALLLGMLSSLPQGIYWMTGSVSYVLGCIMTVIYIGILVRYMQREYFINRGFHLVLSALVLGITIGFSEVLMTLIFIGHGLVWLSLNKEKKFKSFWLGMGLVALLFSLVIYIAPGNAVRSSTCPDTHLFWHSLGMTALQMVRFFSTWVFYAPLMIASLLFIGFGDRLYEHSALFRKLAAIKWWQVFLLLWIILFVCVFPTYWYTGILGQHRTLNVACYAFIPTWFLFVYTTYRKFKLNGSPQFLPIKAQGFIAILLAGCILFSGNSGAVLLEFSKGQITGFNNEMNVRYSLIEAAKHQGQKEVSVPVIKNQPSSLFVLDLQPDCTHWINTLYAQYFSINKVCLATDSTK